MKGVMEKTAHANNNNSNVANRDFSVGRDPELSTRSNRTLVLLSSTSSIQTQLDHFRCYHD